MIRLLIFDAGHTLGEFEPPGQQDVAALSPLHPRIVGEEMRRFLHCAPQPTPELLTDFCEALHIDPAALPQDWTSGFTPFRYAAEAVGAMLTRTDANAVVLSNLPCTTGPSRIADLQRQLPMIGDCYTSYTMGLRKPDQRLWRSICDAYEVSPHEAVHIGDQWTSDVHGAIRAGCHALFLDGTRPGNTAPPIEDWPAGADRIHVAPDLSQALSIVGDIHES